MTGYPIDELDTSALSALLRRLTGRVLEAEVLTSVDTGVSSCLLLNAEPVFRRLRDDLLDEIFLVGMTESVVFKMQRVKGRAPRFRTNSKKQH